MPKRTRTHANYSADSRKKRRAAFGSMTSDEYHATASEADIQGGICELLDLLGIPYSVTDASRSWRQNGKVGQSKVAAGWPDVSAVLPPTGRALFIETKAADGRTSPAQEACHRLLRAAGAVVLIPRSIGDVAATLATFGFRV